jgi:exonuclease III
MRLQIATQNVWGLPEPFAEDVIPRIQALADALIDRSEDVFVFQEAWIAQIRKILRDGGRRAGFVHHWSPAGGIGGGLLILSRLPFDQRRFEPFLLTGTLGRLNRGEYIGGKGFAVVRLLTESGPVWLVNTHLHANYRSGQTFMGNAVRTAQLLQLLDALPKTGEPVIVAGDFNCADGDSEYVIWKELSGMRDAALAFPQAPGTISADNYYKRDLGRTDRRIDYLFVHDGAELALQPVSSSRIFDGPIRLEGLGGRLRPISDHYGLSFAFDLEPSIASQSVATRRAVGPDVISRARQLLESAKAEINREEITYDFASGSLAMMAGGFGLVRSNKRVSRRGFLHSALGIAGLATLGPAFALKAVALSDAESQRNAFTAATETLAKFDRLGARSHGAADPAAADRSVKRDLTS